MDSTFEALERLSALHKAGALTDEEFAAEKAKVLSRGAAGPSSSSPQPASSEKLAKLSATWRKRCAFFEQHGSPYSTEGANALQQLPFWTQSSIRFNVWAFLFGPFYLLFLGIWKRAASLFGVAILAVLVADKFGGDGLSRAVGIAFNVIFAMTANYYYFIKLTQGRDEWNPLADLVVRQA